MKSIYDLKINDFAYVLDTQGRIIPVKIESIDRAKISYNGDYSSPALIAKICDTGTKIKLNGDRCFIADRKKALLESKKRINQAIVSNRELLLKKVNEISLSIEMLHDLVLEIDDEIIREKL